MPTPRRARRLARLWRTERRTFRQALVALALSTAASFVAGLTLGSISMPVLLGIGSTVAVLTSRFDPDPDDHAVPVTTSVMDLTGVMVIIASMSLIGVRRGRP